jgi:hypothetical protein
LAVAELFLLVLSSCYEQGREKQFRTGTRLFCQVIHTAILPLQAKGIVKFKPGTSSYAIIFTYYDGSILIYCPMKKMVPYCALSLFVFMVSCAPSRFVKPLEKGQQALNASLGGPLIGYGSAIIPVPMVTATYGYGLDSVLTGFGSLNLTSAFYGNFQIELGVTRQLIRQKGKWPALSVSPVANFIYRNKDAVKFYPQLDLNAFWEFNQKRNFFYAGVSNWFELSNNKTLEQDQPHHWLFTPQIGQTFVRKNHDFNIEIKAVAINVTNHGSVADYKTPFGKQGAFGMYVSYTRKF